MSSITKKRVSDLKRLSVQLRDSTENNCNINANLVQAILSSTSRRLSNTAATTAYPILQQDEPKHNSSIFKMLLGNSPQSSPNNTSKSKNNTHNKSSHNVSNLDEQQLISLREENVELQKTVKSMKVSLQRLSQLQKKNQQDIDKQGLPYFKIHEQVQAFLTRLTIAEKDYTKINFINYEIELNVDSIFMDRKMKTQLHLRDLKEVHYLDNNIILFQFEPNYNQNTSLFIKLPNEKELHRWDISMYINWKITISLQKTKLFNLPVEQQPVEEDVQQKENDTNQEMDIEELARMVKKRESMYMQAKKQLQDKVARDMPQKMGKYLLHEGVGNVKVQDSPNIPLFHAFQTTLSVQPDQRQQTSKFQQEEYKNEQDKIIEEQRLLQQRQRQQQQALQLQKKQQQQKKIMISLINLKKGYNFTKFSKDGFNPHDKKVYISYSGEQLCWEDAITHKDQKQIPLSSIKGILYVQIAEGIRKHVTNAQKLYYGVIVYLTKDNTKKTIELGSKSNSLMHQFIQELNILKENKSFKNI